MVNSYKLGAYMFFIVALGIWTGGGLFDTISHHLAWGANPVEFIRNQSVRAGTINPWPLTTGLLALATVAALACFVRHRGAGRREVLFVLAATVLILICTGVYFVPTLIKLEHHAALAEAQIVSMSQTWIQLNAVRIVALLFLFGYALVGLVRLVRTPVK